jgi:hypothetical protein
MGLGEKSRLQMVFPFMFFQHELNQHWVMTFLGFNKLHSYHISQGQHTQQFFYTFRQPRIVS